MIRPFRALLASTIALLTAIPSAAHEFWIDPRGFFVAPGDRIVADLRVGQEFEGSAMSYIPRNFTRFEIAQGESVVPVEGRMGDRPALQADFATQGLVVVLYETTDSFVTYEDPAIFQRFVTHKDFPEVLDRHRARGLPASGFTEVYTRHVKSLIAVGDGQGQDRAFGLRTEFVALANPYTDDLTGGMPMQLLFEGAPRVDVQVELWDRAPDGAVSVNRHRTDARGEVHLPVQPGHVYMADAVTMLELGPDAPRGAVWQSVWASLTFAVPQ